MEVKREGVDASRIRCLRCGELISPDDKVCPRCGLDIETKKSSRGCRFLLLLLIVLLASVVILAVVLTPMFYQ